MRVIDFEIEEILKYVISHGAVALHIVRLQKGISNLTVRIAGKMNIQIFFKLAEQDICPQVLGKSKTGIFISHSIEEIFLCKRPVDHAPIIECAMSPRIRAREHGGCSRCRKVSRGKMPVIDRGSCDELLQIWGC